MKKSDDRKNFNNTRTKIMEYKKELFHNSNLTIAMGDTSCHQTLSPEGSVVSGHIADVIPWGWEGGRQYFINAAAPT